MDSETRVVYSIHRIYSLLVLYTVDVVTCAIITFTTTLYVTAAVSRLSVEWKVVLSRMGVAV